MVANVVRVEARERPVQLSDGEIPFTQLTVAPCMVRCSQRMPAAKQRRIRLEKSGGSIRGGSVHRDEGFLGRPQ